MRYEYLLTAISEYKPKTIIEVGARNGRTGAGLMNAASKFYPINELMYYGFDLWENLTHKQSKLEFNGKKIVGKQACEIALAKFPHKLIQGDTNNTLASFKPDREIDLVFIDGGHSLTTIQNDWTNISRLMHSKTVVIFDDYYHNENNKYKFGCATLVDGLTSPYIVTPLGKPDKIGNVVQLMKVTME